MNTLDTNPLRQKKFVEFMNNCISITISKDSPDKAVRNVLEQRNRKIMSTLTQEEYQLVLRIRDTVRRFMSKLIECKDAQQLQLMEACMAQVLTGDIIVVSEQEHDELKQQVA